MLIPPTLVKKKLDKKYCFSNNTLIIIEPVTNTAGNSGIRNLLVEFFGQKLKWIRKYCSK